MTFNPKRRILIAMDNSPNSNYAMNWFLEKEYQDGDFLIFVHILEQPKLKNLDISEGFKLPVEHWQNALSAEVKKFEVIKSECVAKCANRGAQCDCIFTMGGKPGEVIIMKAQEVTADWIIMGTRGLSKIPKLFLGSVSQYVVNNSDIPVTVVPMPESS